MIQMEVGYEEHVDLLGINAVEEGQAFHSVITGIDAAVDHEGGSVEGEEVARSSHLLPRAKKAAYGVERGRTRKGN